MERKEKRFTDVLRNIAMGKSKTFKLESSMAINSCKAIAYRLQYDLGCKFSAESDYINRTLTLTKLPR